MIRKMTALALLVGLAAAIGCGGGGMKSVEGTVTLDGKAVEGATVSFLPENGKGESPSGFTDSSGRFSLKTGGKTGAPPGNYKVTVTKTAALQGGAEGMKPGSPEYQKMMEKGMAKGPAGAPKSELPDVYSNASKTPLKATVPPPEPIKLDLSSKK